MDSEYDIYSDTIQPDDSISKVGEGEKQKGRNEKPIRVPELLDALDDTIEKLRKRLEKKLLQDRSDEQGAIPEVPTVEGNSQDLVTYHKQPTKRHSSKRATTETVPYEPISPGAYIENDAGYGGAPLKHPNEFDERLYPEVFGCNYPEVPYLYQNYSYLHGPQVKFSAPLRLIGPFPWNNGQELLNQTSQTWIWNSGLRKFETKSAVVLNKNNPNTPKDDEWFWQVDRKYVHYSSFHQCLCIKDEARGGLLKFDNFCLKDFKKITTVGPELGRYLKWERDSSGNFKCAQDSQVESWNNPNSENFGKPPYMMAGVGFFFKEKHPVQWDQPLGSWLKYPPVVRNELRVRGNA